MHRGTMQRISRRNLISSGLAFSATCLAMRPTWARAIAFHDGNMPGDDAQVDLAVSPREQLLFDFGWKFVLGDGNDP